MRPLSRYCGVWLGRMRAGALALPVFGILTLAIPSSAQVLTIDTSGRSTAATQAAGIDRRFRQIEPTHVALPASPMTSRSRQALLRFLIMEPGFAMRPFPGGHKGLTLVANGKLDPAGEAYLDMVTNFGVSAKPGDRVVITDVKVERSRITLDFNGGPDLKHRFLRHIYVGDEVYQNPIIQDDGSVPTGSRITLVFSGRVPELTGSEVESLLAPLVSFNVKSPAQAFTDTLPPMLKDAILNHHVLVGMSTDMVLYSKGQPDQKIREMDGQMPFEEWIYGKPPHDVEFVRINGNRVIRVELAAVGKTPVIFTRDVVDGMLRTDGTPVVPPENNSTHAIELGDVHRNPDTQSAAAPPTLRNPGEKLPTDNDKDSRVGVMKPVQFPKQAPDDAPVAHQPQTQAATPPAQPGNAGAQQPGATGSPASSPASTQQPAEQPAHPTAAPPAQQFEPSIAQLQ